MTTNGTIRRRFAHDDSGRAYNQLKQEEITLARGRGEATASLKSRSRPKKLGSAYSSRHSTAAEETVGILLVFAETGVRS
jgi:hypothetical protein